MEPFSIFCTTCKARLKVRDGSAIGQILACPKCGSMVLVEPPGAEAAMLPSGSAIRRAMPPEVAAMPETRSDSAFEELDALLADEPPVAAPPSAEKHTWKSAHETQAPLSISTAATAADSAGDSGDAPAAVPAPAGSAAHSPYPASPIEGNAVRAADLAAEPLLPGDQWVSPAILRWRQWAIFAGAALAGLAIAVVLWGFLIARSANTTAAGPGLPGTEEAAMSPADESVPSASSSAPQDPRPGADDVTSPPEDDPAHDRDPSGSLEGDVPPADGTEDAPPSASAEPPVVEDEGDGGATGDSDDLDDPEAADEAPREFAGHWSVPHGDLPDDLRGNRPAPASVDVTAQLAERFPQVEFRNAPLIDYLRFITALSTVPVTIDPDALAFAGVSPTSPVQVTGTDITVAEMLSQALAPRGLSYQIDGSHVIVCKQGPADGSLRQVRYDLTDLGGDDPSVLASLSDLLRRMVGTEFWAEGGGAGVIVPAEGALVVAQSEPAHFVALVLFEKLRVARGLSPRSRFRPALFALASRTVKVRETLEKPVSINFNRPTPLADILARLAEISGATLLVDWQALAESHWGTDALATLTVDGVTLGEALDALLVPMDLAWRAVDEKTLQVTTPAALHRLPEVEFYRAGDLVDERIDADRLIERIQRNLGPHLFSGDAGGVVVFDAPSQHLIVRLPQVHQRRLAWLLDQWRTAD